MHGVGAVQCVRPHPGWSSSSTSHTSLALGRLSFSPGLGLVLAGDWCNCACWQPGSLCHESHSATPPRPSSVWGSLPAPMPPTWLRPAECCCRGRPSLRRSVRYVCTRPPQCPRPVRETHLPLMRAAPTWVPRPA